MMKENSAMDTFELSICDIGENAIRELSALELAYIGDTVYDLYIRSYLVINKMGKVSDLHKHASGVVNARAQALAAGLLQPFFTERELEIFRMGKNAKSTPPKNMSHEDYSLATAVEAVIGYLYCRKNNDRLIELFRIIIKHFFMED